MSRPSRLPKHDPEKGAVLRQAEKAGAKPSLPKGEPRPCKLCRQLIVRFPTAASPRSPFDATPRNNAPWKWDGTYMRYKPGPGYGFTSHHSTCVGT